MRLQVPKKFVGDLFGDLYHHILPECDLFGRSCGVLLEPIYIFAVQDCSIAEWGLVDQYIDPAFNVLQCRERIAAGLECATGSNLDQILVAVDTGVFALWDNPLEFPGERLARFIRDALPSVSGMASTFCGICHFHPTGIATHGEDDERTMREITGKIARYGRDRLISLILAMGNAAQYVKEAAKSHSDFVTFMMSRLDELRFEAREFRSCGNGQPLCVALV